MKLVGWRSIIAHLDWGGVSSRYYVLSDYWDVHPSIPWTGLDSQSSISQAFLDIKTPWVKCSYSIHGATSSSIDWFKGQITGQFHMSWENLWFPVEIPLSQPIDMEVFISHDRTSRRPSKDFFWWAWEPVGPFRVSRCVNSLTTGVVFVGNDGKDEHDETGLAGNDLNMCQL